MQQLESLSRLIGETDEVQKSSLEVTITWTGFSTSLRDRMCMIFVKFGTWKKSVSLKTVLRL